MLLSLVLTGLLAAQAAPAQTPPATHDTAMELAQSGDYKEALEMFRRIAAANPRDLTARLWIARLHGWMGRHDLAEPVFRNVVLEDRGSVEAKLGLGVTLVALGRASEAVRILEDAERLAPENPEVLVALGRAYRYTGETTRSMGYLQRAVGMAPTSGNLLALEQTRLVHDHRVESTSFFESFNLPVSDTGSTDLLANVRLTDQFRIIGRGQAQRKFGVSEARGGLGLEWRWRAQTSVFAHALVGPGNDILPRADGNLEVAHVQGNFDWVFGVRYVDFSASSIVAMSPGATWWPTDRLSLGLRYATSVTDAPYLTAREIGHTAQLRGSYLVYPRVWVNVGYTRGIENFDTLSPDRLASLSANTASGGLRIDLPTLTSLVGQYEYQWRESNTEMNRFTISFAQRF